MFATAELARRIDRAEARLTEELGRAVVDRHPTGDAFVASIGGGVAAFTAPASPMNKMIGVGFDTLPDDAELDAVERRFSAREAPLQAEVSALANPAFAARLTRRGYTLAGFENVLGRSIVDTGLPDGPIAITIMHPDESARWLDAAVAGFIQPDAQGAQGAPLPPREELTHVLQDYFEVPSHRRYCAWIGGELAGVASLRLDAGVAQLCGATTLPAFRRRGVQTMLLGRRIADAARDGCDVAVMTTLPGSKSQENGQRQGFALLYARAILVKSPSTVAG
jgi:hypothetical protein